MRTAAERSLRERAAGLFLFAGLSVSSALFLYPYAVEERAQITQTAQVAGYQEEVDETGEENLEAEGKKADAYNAAIRERQKREKFHYLGETATDAQYEETLKNTDGIMGYLEIPSCDIYLPFAHGTRAETLRTMAGHMYGTSLPVGGPGTHAVLAGHTGLPSAELFSSLEKVKEGDCFEIHVLGRKLHYRVKEVLTVLPEEADSRLSVREGMDLVTLYTCTPYGINDHRLLVCGEREIPDSEDAGAAEETEAAAVIRCREAVLRYVCALSVPFLLAAAGAADFLRRKK